MAREKIIACIGASDEDVAHLRLLLKTAGARLDAPWQWGHEEKADLVIVDTSSLAGSTALIRVNQRGVPCAELIDADAPEPEGLFLRKPMNRDAFVALLNGGSRPAVAPLTVLSQDDDFFMVDLGEYEDDGDANAELPSFQEVPQRNLPSSEELDAFEALFKRDELAETPLMLTPDKLEAKTGIEYTGERTARSSTNAHERKPFINDSQSPLNVDPSLRSFSNVQDEGAHPLHAYLTGSLLGSPCRIALPGLPALVLDPKDQLFHAEGPLSALEEYCRRPLRRADWQPLMSSELRDVRERVPARSYPRLLWLDRMFSSDGYLSPHLDPAGSFRLLQAFEDIAEEYPRAHRIAQAMKAPLRLHEIVAESQTSMAEVFTVVSAYDAIGWVEWQLRESMRSPAKPAR
jgi:hypothetical protein